MDNLEIPGTEGLVQEIPANAAPKVRKQKAVKPLNLGMATMIDGVKNATLESTLKKRYARIAFYTSTKPDAKPYAVVHDTVNPKLVKSPGASMEHFIYALVEAALSGASMSGDGAAVFVVDAYPKVLASAPKFPGYVLEIVPAGTNKAGLKTYRATVSDWMFLVSKRASVIKSSMKIAGTKRRTTRDVVEKAAPQKVSVTF
jgi:hypothetical protein